MNLAGITKFKYKRKNERDSGRNNKMTPLCKWPNSKYSNFTRRGSCDRNITLTVNLYEDALPRGKLTNSQLIEMFVLLKVLNQLSSVSFFELPFGVFGFHIFHDNNESSLAMVTSSA